LLFYVEERRSKKAKVQNVEYETEEYEDEDEASQDVKSGK